MLGPAKCTTGADQKSPPAGRVGKIFAAQAATAVYVMRTLHSQTHAWFDHGLRIVPSSPNFDCQARIGFHIFDDLVIPAYQLVNRRMPSLRRELRKLIQVQCHKLLNFEDIDPFRYALVVGQSLGDSDGGFVP